MIKRLAVLPEPPAALLQELAETAARTAGMTASMLDRRVLRQTLHRRLTATQHEAPSPDTYLTLYRSSPAEQSAFLEGILNHETSFFRDAAVFAELQRWAQLWFATNNRPMRILSAPCSTGEEPYSIAAVLEQLPPAQTPGTPFLTAHLGHERDRTMPTRNRTPPTHFTIEALDLSAAAITHAQTGIYTGLSLRNIPNPENSTFLEPIPGTTKSWQVSARLRDTIHFRQANLLSPEALPPRAYDLICSRNLLLYQTPKARLQVAQALAAALAPNGRLILGAADWGRDLDTLFRLQEPINSFALELRENELRENVHRKNILHKPSTNPPARFHIQPAATHAEASNLTPETRLTSTPGEHLADISTLYRHALEAYLHPDEPTAERLCRKILYLDNDHLPSLELLAKIKRPQASTRLQLALKARLSRHRQASGGAV